MKDYFLKRPMLSCGILGSFIIIIGYISNILLIFAGVFLIILFFICLYYKIQLKFLVVIIFMLLNVFSMCNTMNNINYCEKSDSKIVNGSYIVTQISGMKNNMKSVVLQVSKSDVLKAGTQINVYCKNSNIEYGEYLDGNIIVKKFNNKNKLFNYSKGIYLMGYLKDYSINTNNKDYVISGFNSVRQFIKTKLFSTLQQEEASTIMALVSGDKSFLSEKFYGNVKKAGVSHVMVVSGMHLAIIVSFITAICELLFYNKYFKFFSVLLTVLFMMCLCGYTMSIVRAGFSYMLYAVSLLLERNNTPENTLGCAVEFILIFTPLAIFNLSFLLSVLSTLGIVTVALPIIKYIKATNKINMVLIGIMSAFIISLSAMIFTLPITTFFFNYISTVSVITNILISFAVTVVLELVLCGLIISIIFPTIGDVIIHLSGAIVKYINYIINLMGSFEFSILKTGKFTFIISLLIIFIIIVALLLVCQ